MKFQTLFLMLALSAAAFAQVESPLANAPAAIESLGAAPADPAAALARVRADLANERVTSFGGGSTDLLAKLEALPESVLSGAQRARVLTALSEIYEMNLRLEASIPEGPGKGYQLVNWQHTRTEVNEVIDAMLNYNARAAQAGRPLLTATQFEDAVLAAAFSDSVKLPPGSTGNFFRHHLDGAEAARRFVERAYPGDTDRVNRVVAAIQEHQIVPPEFMGNLARHGMVGRRTGELTAAFAREFPGDLTPDGKPNVATESGRAFKAVLDRVNAATAVEGQRAPLALEEPHLNLLRRLGTNPAELTEWTAAVNGARDRIASPLTQARTADGTRIAFSAAEANALRNIGINDWIVPVENAPHAQISTFVRVGDTAANYMSSPAGLAKILAIRGPGTPFADHTVWDSIRSAERSYRDALKVIPEEFHAGLNDMRARTLTAIRQQGADTRDWVAAHKARAGYTPDEPVLFFDKRASTANLTPEQLAARTAFAKDIRGHFEQGLRGRQDAFAAAGRPAQIPQGPFEGSLLGVRSQAVRNAAVATAKGTAVGAAVGVGIEAARELITEGKIDGGALWNNTLGNLNDFWKPLAGGTAGALAAGALVSRFLPGGGVISAGAQFLGGSLGASAASGHLRREPGRAAAGAVGSAVGAVAGGAALSWLLPPVGSFIGSTVGGIAGQVGGELLYDTFKSRDQVAARPQLRGMSI